MNARTYAFISGVILTGKGVQDLNWVKIGAGTCGMISAANEKAAQMFNRVIAISYAGIAVAKAMPKLLQSLPHSETQKNNVEMRTKNWQQKMSGHSQFIPTHENYNRNNGHGRNHPHH